jgi:hypothetical protein
MELNEKAQPMMAHSPWSGHLLLGLLSELRVAAQWSQTLISLILVTNLILEWFQRRMPWDVQGGRRWPQAARPVGWPPTGCRKVKHSGP